MRPKEFFQHGLIAIVGVVVSALIVQQNKQLDKIEDSLQTLEREFFQTKADSAALHERVKVLEQVWIPKQPKNTRAN